MSTSATTPYIWTIIERFFQAQVFYMGEHDRYESLVAQYVKRFGIPRGDIRLEPEELSGLLQFKQLERLRDDYLSPLKDACHALFRTDDSTDYLDRLVNDIFHETSILKEEHYNVLTYGPHEEHDGHGIEQETILAEAHDLFPIKVHRLRHLFEMARKRIEEILPSYKENRVLIRSLFLYRNDFVEDSYAEGLVDFYCVLYGRDRAFEGFRVVGDSFLDSGFYKHAIDSYRTGQQFLDSAPNAARKQFHESWRETARRFDQGIQECERQLAHLEED